MASLTLSGITKTFGTVTAVDNLDLEVHDGEFLVLVGPSGCGKTTILRMIAGLDSPDRGSIRFGNRDMLNVTPRERDVAMVFQHNALYPHMTVYGNLAFGLQQRGVPRMSIEQQVHEVGVRLNIHKLLERFPRELSGGQQQRVALGRAMMRRPQVFLCDEPLSDLDADLRVKIRTELKRHHMHLGQTMVYVTHDQTEAMTLADRIVVISNGVLQQIASPSQLYHHPVNPFVARFIGSPTINFFQGLLQSTTRGSNFVHDDFHIRLPEIHSPQSNAAVLLGIRPEHISIDEAKPILRATVDFVEFAGDSTFVHLSANATQIVMRQPIAVDSTSAAAITDQDLGKPVGLRFDADKIHLFDATSGRRIPAMNPDSFA